MSERDDKLQSIIPSKSQLKRENAKLQLLGRQLVEMPDNQLQKFTLEENLLTAIYEARRLKHRDAIRRQIQYLGKLMRSADLESIELTMDKLNHQSKTFRQHCAKIEAWRERILGEGGPAIEALIEVYPNADRQQLRNLQRQANREKENKRSPVASRRLLEYLRELAD